MKLKKSRENWIYSIERSRVLKNTIKRSYFRKIALKGCSVIDFYHSLNSALTVVHHESSLIPPFLYDIWTPLVITNLQQEMALLLRHSLSESWFYPQRSRHHAHLQ